MQLYTVQIACSDFRASGLGLGSVAKLWLVVDWISGDGASVPFRIASIDSGDSAAFR